MDLTVILGIFTFFYFVTLFIMCFYRNKIHVRSWNLGFFIANFIVYSCWTYAAYLYTDWMGGGWLTLGNISPMTFTVIVLLPIMNARVREYAMSSIACLSLGMFFAMLISPEFDYIFNFNTQATFLNASDILCHMVCSLFGIYLILSKQVKPDFNHWLKSVIFTLSIITFGVILNFIYHRNYFGMNPYGTAMIYMLDLFSGFWPTLVAYYFGVVMVLTVGMQVGSLLEKATAKIIEHENAGAGVSESEGESDESGEMPEAEQGDAKKEAELQENRQLES